MDKRLNIIITGGAGFIGYHLSKKLSESHNVTIIDRKVGIEIGSFEFYQTMLRQKYDVVFHLAANSDISVSNPKIEKRDTEETTFEMLDMCRRLDIKQFIFASTSAIFGNVDGPIREETAFNPINYYGSAKLASEALIHSAARRQGIKAWICRFPNVVGSHATHGVIFDLVARYLCWPGPLRVLGRGDQKKPYIHASELIEAILFIWKNSKELINTYNISPAGQTTVRDIAHMITNGSIEYVGDEAWPGDCQQYRYDTSKLTALGWAARMTSSEAVKLAIQEIKAELS